MQPGITRATSLRELSCYFSGCDNDGWLARKHVFIGNKIACGRLQVRKHEHALIAVVYSIMNELVVTNPLVPRQQLMCLLWWGGKIPQQDRGIKRPCGRALLP